MNLIGILCQDHVYNKRLSEYLMSRGNANYCINSFSDMDGFLDYVRRTKFDLLIVEENLYTGLMDLGKREQIARHYLILKDEIVEPTAVSSDSLLICRYISTAFILEYIHYLLHDYDLLESKVMEYSLISDKTGDYGMMHVGMQASEQCCIIGIFSEVHCCGKTSLAFLLSQFCNEKGRSLYMPMDYRNPVFSSKERCLANMIYMLFRESDGRNYRELTEKEFDEDSFADLLQKNVRVFDDIEYIPCSSYRADMDGIEDYHIEKIMEYMKGQKLYRYFIIDFSDGTDFKRCLSLCDYVMTPLKDDCFSRQYVDNFKEEWKTFCKRENIVDYDEKKIFEHFRFLQLPKTLRTSSVSNYYKELEWSPLAGVAKQLVDEIAL